MTPREAFKVGFLAYCAERGLGADEVGALVKRASIFGEVVRAPLRLASSVAPTALNAALIGAIGLPIVAGAGTGWAAAKLTDDDSDVDAARSDEILAEYQRLTDQARRQSALKALQGQSTLGLNRSLAGAA